MPRGELTLLGDLDHYMLGMSTENLTVGVATPTGSKSFSMLQSGAIDPAVEPSIGRPGLNGLNRVIMYMFTRTSPPADFDVQLQFSRDDTGWADVGPIVEATLTAGNGETEGTLGPVLDGPMLPTNFMTIAGEATDINDTLRHRIEVTHATGSAFNFAYVVMLLPSITATQTKPLMGNVFSGSQWG